MRSPNNAFAASIKAALDEDERLYAVPTDLFYQTKDVKPYNLAIPVRPAAITYPRTTAQVAAIIKCAAAANLKVQARSGGHSYANYCLGGVDGAVVIDMKHFQHFSMDPTTFRARVGAGTLLGDLTQRLHDAGHRAIAHGTCPQVGIGGHATIGGLGPSSRMWGSTLDHVEEVTIVLADSTITRASATEYPDLFFAVRGAGASFGVITEFVFRTQPEPIAVQFSFSFTARPYMSMATAFKSWQTFISDPKLTRKFSTKVVLTEIGMVISGTYFGTRVEYESFNIKNKFPSSQASKPIMFKEWLGVITHWSEEISLHLGGGIPAPFYTKTLAFNETDLIPEDAIDRFFTYLDKVEKGTLMWFIIFDLVGGAVNDVPQEATAYAHRDALFYMQSYALGVTQVSHKAKEFLRGVKSIFRDAMPSVEKMGTYPGFVDPELNDGPWEYWRSNLPRLQRIKEAVDPCDIFHNPQGVKPASSVIVSSASMAKQHIMEGALFPMIC